MLDQTEPTRVSVIADAGGLAAAAAPGIATGIIKSVAELINLFRTDTSFQNKAITINEDMVVSYILKNLADNGFKLGDKTLVTCSNRPVVYYPSLFPPLLTQLTSATPSPLFQLLDDIEMEKVQAAANVTAVDARLKVLNDLAGKVEDIKSKSKELDKDNKDKDDKEAALKNPKTTSAQAKKLRDEIKTLKETINKLNLDIAKLKNDLGAAAVNAGNFKDWIAKLTDLKVKMQGLITATDLVTNKLNTPDESTKLTALAQLLRAERLYSILKDTDTYTLRVAVNANGTTKIKKNLFVDAKVRHAAGANLVYQLFSKDGAVTQGGALQCYIDYKSSQSVRDVASGLGSVECLFPTDASNTISIKVLADRTSVRASGSQ